jgi:hypothetical protein
MVVNDEVERRWSILRVRIRLAFREAKIDSIPPRLKPTLEMVTSPR